MHVCAITETHRCTMSAARSFCKIKNAHLDSVGAGSAGCRLAEKLSAIQDVKVLLLEAGGAPPDFTAIPLLTRLSFEGDWVQRYRVEPMKNAFITKPNQVGCANTNGEWNQDQIFKRCVWERRTHNLVYL